MIQVNVNERGIVDILGLKFEQVVVLIEGMQASADVLIELVECGELSEEDALVFADYNDKVLDPLLEILDMNTDGFDDCECPACTMIFTDGIEGNGNGKIH